MSKSSSRPAFDIVEEGIRQSRSPRPVTEGLSLFDAPEIKTPVSSAPGSESSREAAEAVTDPMRARSHRLIMLALGSAARPLSREELSARLGVKESSLCARLAELRPEYVEAVDRACVASSGKSVDGYRLTSSGRNRLKGAA